MDSQEKLIVTTRHRDSGVQLAWHQQCLAWKHTLFDSYTTGLQRQAESEPRQAYHVSTACDHEAASREEPSSRLVIRESNRSELPDDLAATLKCSVHEVDLCMQWGWRLQQTCMMRLCMRIVYRSAALKADTGTKEWPHRSQDGSVQSMHTTHMRICK